MAFAVGQEKPGPIESAKHSIAPPAAPVQRAGVEHIAHTERPAFWKPKRLHRTKIAASFIQTVGPPNNSPAMPRQHETTRKWHGRNDLQHGGQSPITVNPRELGPAMGMGSKILTISDRGMLRRASRNVRATTRRRDAALASPRSTLKECDTKGLPPKNDAKSHKAFWGNT
jgi:hypothetical protein